MTDYVDGYHHIKKVQVLANNQWHELYEVHYLWEQDNYFEFVGQYRTFDEALKHLEKDKGEQNEQTRTRTHCLELSVRYKHR